MSIGTNQDRESQELLYKELKRLRKAVDKQNSYYSPRSYLLRSLVQGLVTAFGATVGLALILIYAARILSGVSTLPIVETILQETQLDKIIQYQLRSIEQSPTPTLTPYPTLFPTTSPAPSPSPSPSPSTSVTPTSAYNKPVSG